MRITARAAGRTGFIVRSGADDEDFCAALGHRAVERGNMPCNIGVGPPRAFMAKHI